MATTALVRHYFNLRHRGWNVWPILVAGAVALAAIAWADPPAAAPSPAASAGRRSRSRSAQAIVQQRCVTCHSADPTRDGFDAPPKGIAFDTPEQIVAQAQLIDRWAVQSKAMPLGNVTGMTDAERAELGRGSRRERTGRLTRPCSRSPQAPFSFRAELHEEAAPQTGRRVPAAASAREPDHPRALVGRGRLDPVGRPRPRHRPGERDPLPEPGRADPLPGRRQRDRAAARLRLRRLRVEGGRSSRATTSPRSSRASENLRELGRRLLWEGAQEIRFTES